MRVSEKYKKKPNSISLLTYNGSNHKVMLCRILASKKYLTLVKEFNFNKAIG